MSTPEKHLTARHAARRKLLRGTFAAPAVLTLYSGSALATGSSLRCLSYQAGTNQTVGVVTTTTDTYVRIGLYPMTADANRFWIKGSDVAAKWVTGHVKSSFIQSSHYWEFHPLNNVLIGPSSTSADPLLNAATKWAALRFDAQGNAMGVGASGTGAAMPGTCWISAAPFI